MCCKNGPSLWVSPACIQHNIINSSLTHTLYQAHIHSPSLTLLLSLTHCFTGPWVNNCVGISNHKFFLLFLLYIFLVSLHGLYLLFRRYYYMCNILEIALYRKTHIPHAHGIFGLLFGEEDSNKCYTSTYGLILQVWLPPLTHLFSLHIFLSLDIFLFICATSNQPFSNCVCVIGVFAGWGRAVWLVYSVYDVWPSKYSAVYSLTVYSLTKLTFTHNSHCTAPSLTFTTLTALTAPTVCL